MYASVINVRKPRQKSSRWFLVDFETMEHAEEFKKILIEKKEVAGIKVKPNKLNIKEHDPLNKPDNERKQYVNTLTKQTFQAKNLEKYSNKLLITNLPENVSALQISDLFPHHLKVDLKYKPKLRAIVTYSSAKEAMQYRKCVRPVIDGTKFRVIMLLADDDNLKKRKTSDSDKNSSPSKKEPEVDVSKKKLKTKKKQPHAFIKPLRYFETE